MFDSSEVQVLYPGIVYHIITLQHSSRHPGRTPNEERGTQSFVRASEKLASQNGDEFSGVDCAYREFCAAYGGCHSPNRTAKVKQVAGPA
jgi:hypothetical protein